MKKTTILTLVGLFGTLASLISGCAQMSPTTTTSIYTLSAFTTTKPSTTTTPTSSIASLPVSPVTTTTSLPSPLVYPTLQIKLHPDNPGPTIPSDFLGFSFEDPVLAGDYFDVNNNVYINLLRNLGDGVLRFGGNSVEFTYWSRITGTTFPSSRAVLVPSDLDRLFAFTAKTNWHVIFGLNLGANNPGMAADEAAYAWQVGQNSIIGFEVGNEPDLYSRNGLRPTTYVYSDFRQEFTKYLQSIRGKVPNAPIAGPVTAYNYDWFSNFMKDEKTNLVLGTQHLYPLSASSTLKPTDASYATIDKLLSASITLHTINSIQQFESIAKANNIPLRYAETNSASSGGKDGVSNAFASALWGTDYLFNLAENGVVGANFHGGFSTHGYTPIGLDKNNQYVAMPLYYGMLLFHDVAQGRTVPVELNTTINVTAHAVLGNDGALRLVIINKDANQTVNADINPGKSYSGASASRLTAPSLDATTGITFGGNSVRADGTWTADEEEMVTQNGPGYHIVVPSASAVVITFR
jgi:hypothetical protein